MANFRKKLVGTIQYGEYYKPARHDMEMLFQKYKSEGKRVAVWGAGLKEMLSYQRWTQEQSM